MRSSTLALAKRPTHHYGQASKDDLSRKRDKKLVLELEQMLVTQVPDEEMSETYAVRPDWELFFETTRRQYEIVIWTILPKKKAMRLMPIIDPHRRITTVLCLENCKASMLTEDSSVYVKIPDPAVFKKESSIFLDVSPFSIARVQDNSYLLPPFTGRNDEGSNNQLLELLPVLRTMQYLKDVRPVNMHMEQHFKKKQELKELSTMKVPEDESRQRQHIRIQKFNSNSISILNRMKKQSRNLSSSMMKSGRLLDVQKGADSVSNIKHLASIHLRAQEPEQEVMGTSQATVTQGENSRVEIPVSRIGTPSKQSRQNTQMMSSYQQGSRDFKSDLDLANKSKRLERIDTFSAMKAAPTRVREERHAFTQIDTATHKLGDLVPHSTSFLADYHVKLAQAIEFEKLRVKIFDDISKMT